MHKLFWVSGSLLISLASLGFSNGANAKPDRPVSVPADLKVPDDQQPLLKVVAQGDQIYVCKAKADQADQVEWALKAPQAVLLNDKQQEIGKHYGGPTWEAKDGSAIVGQLKAKANAPEADAIPWLLLEVKSHKGEGQFSSINWVQRINTSGGKAPQTGCDRDRLGTEARVEYKADYQFYGVNPQSITKTEPSEQDY
jgi:Protein of unknown function (DUF3455)